MLTYVFTIPTWILDVDHAWRCVRLRGHSGGISQKRPRLALCHKHLKRPFVARASDATRRCWRIVLWFSQDSSMRSRAFTSAPFGLSIAKALVYTKRANLSESSRSVRLDFAVIDDHAQPAGIRPADF